ncbi:MAG TPA: metal-dependent phosphohydrolase, partial [Polyangiaceae bacterium]|nr:metal-dependent phosphohydrolase [Polyangiaceae bacterium]
ADITTKRPEKKRKGLRQIDELADRIRQVQELDAVVPVLPKGIGDAIMAHFKLPPSRVVGEIKRALEAAIDAGDLAGHQPPEFYVDHVAANAERYGIKV